MKRFIEIVRYVQVNFVGILLTITVLAFVYSMIVVVGQDDYAKNKYNWALFPKRHSREEFYDHYKPEFVKQDQKTIDDGLQKWVDKKMNGLGYVKFEDYFYKNGVKIFYDEMPKK